MGIPITDPVELAWCAFARHREEMRMPDASREQGVSIASFKAGAEWERAACADLARAAGCVCLDLLAASISPLSDIEVTGKLDLSGEEPRVAVHDHRCPAAILAAIEARGAR